MSNARLGRLASAMVFGCVVCGATASASGRILHVGLSEPYKTPSAAAVVARDGDTIEIEAGTYSGDVAVWSANHLTLRGVNGLAHLAANGRSAERKAIWVIKGDDTTVEQIEFSGCRVPDQNGAGIRLEGKNLVVRHCRFYDNENGILTGANPASDVLVENSEFDHNGFGNGYSHNLYIGHVRRFTLQFCFSHDAHGGHLVKSRAESNFILYNRLMDGAVGNSSYAIDLPNGGRSIILGNIIQHGPRAETGIAVSYAEEGAKNPVQELYVVNNTFVNERKPSGPFLRVAGHPAVVRVVNNLVVGTPTLMTVPGEATNNLITNHPDFADAAHYDYRLLPPSPAAGAGLALGMAGDFDLAPKFFYHAPLGSDPCPPDAKLNIGACPLIGR